MDWNRVQASWKQLEGKVKAKWGKLTADDLTAINGRNWKARSSSAMALRRIKLGRKSTTGLPLKASSLWPDLEVKNASPGSDDTSQPGLSVVACRYLGA